MDVNENGWRGRIVVTLTNVINPVNNTQLGTGFIINTYADGNQIHIIDHLPNIYLIPQSECAYPCQTCPTSDRENCESCWTTETSVYKYYYYDFVNDYGYCGTNCPDGQSRNGSPSYRCIDCDISCRTCTDLNITHCIECAYDYPFKVVGQPICLPLCSIGYYQVFGVDKVCATCDLPCLDCEGNA